MSAIAAALSALRARDAETRALMERLVRVNSHSANVAGVNAVGDLLSDALLAHPLERVATTDARGVRHLAFATEAAATGGEILLIGHHDTVFPPGEFEGFEVEGDVARGPGVLDMKGGLALIVQTLSALADVGVLARVPICFVCVGDEEIGSPGSRLQLELRAQRSRCALVFEAGRVGDAIITSRRGSGSAEAIAHGRAAHAGNALAEGKSAIWALSRFIDRLQQQNGSIPGASASVGLVSGGTARNTVPERARAEVDLRFADPEAQARLEQLLCATAREVETSLPGLRLELHIHIARRPWPRSEASAALAGRYAAAQRAAGLDASEAGLIGGGSDANTVGALGLPAIDGLGPRGSGFHTKEERVHLSSLPMKAEALLRFLLSESGVGGEPP